MLVARSHDGLPIHVAKLRKTIVGESSSTRSRMAI